MRNLFLTDVENIGFDVNDQCIFKMTVVGVVFQRDYRPSNEIWQYKEIHPNRGQDIIGKHIFSFIFLSGICTSTQYSTHKHWFVITVFSLGSPSPILADIVILLIDKTSFKSKLQ